MSATTRKVLLAMLYFHIGHNRIQTQPQIIEWHPFLTAWYNVDILDVAGMACNWLEFTVADLKIWCTWNNFELWLVCFCYSVAKMAFIFGWYSILDDVVCGWTGMTRVRTIPRSIPNTQYYWPAAIPIPNTDTDTEYDVISTTHHW